MIIERETTDTSFALRGTGMDLHAQMEMILQTRVESNSVSEWKDAIIQKNNADLEGLYFEYLIESGVLPFHLQFSNGRVSCPDYGNKPLPDVVSKAEREGSIYESIQAIENRLIHSKEEDSHVLISPPGWSGYPHPHTTAQIYYYQKKGSEIQSMTFVSRTATLEDCERLQKYLTGQTNDVVLSEKERILSLTSQPLSFKGLSPHDVVSRFEAATQSNLSEMHELIDHRPEIQADVKECIRDFAHFIEYEIDDDTPESLAFIEKMFGKTILDMQSVLTRGRKPQTKAEYYDSYKTFSEHEGCNGGGTIYSRGLTEQAENEEFPNRGICAMKNKCISEKKGEEQALGLCMICKTCDRAFRSGKTLEEIALIAEAKETKNKTKEVEAEGTSLFAKAALSFIVALFAG